MSCWTENLCKVAVVFDERGESKDSDRDWCNITTEKLRICLNSPITVKNCGKACQIVTRGFCIGGRCFN